jgi:hypothetical protein
MIGLPKRVDDRPKAGRTRHRYVPRPSRKRRPRYRHCRGSTSRGFTVDASKTLRPLFENSTRYLVALGTRGQTNVRVVGTTCCRVCRGLFAAGGRVVRGGGAVEARGSAGVSCVAFLAPSTSASPAESRFSVPADAASAVRAFPFESDPSGTKAKAATPAIAASPVTVARTSVRRHDRPAAPAWDGSDRASGCGCSGGREGGIKSSRSVPAAKSRSRTEGCVEGRGPICSSPMRGVRMLSTTSRRSRARRAASGSTSASSGLIGSSGCSRSLAFRSWLIE